MAKRQKAHQISASFHYIVKSMPNDDGSPPSESGFTPAEFQRILNFVYQNQAVDVCDPESVALIKSGHLLPFGRIQEVETGVFVGEYEGAYYGQKYRNNVVGNIDPSSLNLRKFYFLITLMRDGKIIVGVTYHGQFGDYEGIKLCFGHLLQGNYTTAWKTLKIMSEEIGAGTPVEIKLAYRKAPDRPERRPFFGTSGAFVVRRSDFGADFDEQVAEISRKVQGDARNRKKALAKIVNQGQMIEIDDQDIVGCTALVREEGRYRTVYLIGENSQSTKLPLQVDVDRDGLPEKDQLKMALIKAMRDRIVPLIA